MKALGNQLGRFVLVFNCDENFDFQVRKCLNRILSVLENAKRCKIKGIQCTCMMCSVSVSATIFLVIYKIEISDLVN